MHYSINTANYGDRMPFVFLIGKASHQMANQKDKEAAYSKGNIHKLAGSPFIPGISLP
jgi:hypothetical protein